MANTAHAASLGFPYVDHDGFRFEPLAVLGGGPSLDRHIDEIRMWKGERWAINGAFQWCRSHGIEATLFTIHPAAENMVGCMKAILAETCEPAVFDGLRGADIRLFRIGADAPASSGPSSATAALSVAILDGYTDVTFYGTECSFEDGRSHAYPNDEAQPWVLEVLCDGWHYLTEVEYLLQADCLAAAIRSLPSIYRERSGGLLRAMIAADGYYDITRVSRSLCERLCGAPTPKED
jgi:hypothetical protein